MGGKILPVGSTGLSKGALTAHSCFSLALWDRGLYPLGTAGSGHREITEEFTQDS